MRAVRNAMKHADPALIRGLLAAGMVQPDLFTVACCIAFASTACVRELLGAARRAGRSAELAAAEPLLRWYAVKAAAGGDAERLRALLDEWTRSAGGPARAAECAADMLACPGASALSAAVRAPLLELAPASRKRKQADAAAQ